eukprot:6206842-Pleurochrysis_carterae.AAC.4
MYENVKRHRSEGKRQHNYKRGNESYGVTKSRMTWYQTMLAAKRQARQHQLGLPLKAYAIL